MKPETLKEIFETRHPQYAKTKDFELVLHYLKEYEREQKKVIDIIITYLKKI